MPFACLYREKLQVVNERSDLGYGKGKSGNWWALRAFSAMCDQQVDLPYPFTLWVFPAQIQFAVERVLKERNRDLELLPQPEFEIELAKIKSGLRVVGIWEEEKGLSDD